MDGPAVEMLANTDLIGGNSESVLVDDGVSIGSGGRPIAGGRGVHFVRRLGEVIVAHEFHERVAESFGEATWLDVIDKRAQSGRGGISGDVEL